MLEKTLESSLDCKIKPVNPKGNQSWTFIAKTDPEAEAPILWPPDAKNWLTGKDPAAGKDWRQEKGMTEDEMVGWHHRLNGHEFEQTPGVGDGLEDWRAAVRGVTKSQTWLSDWTTRILGQSCLGLYWSHWSHNEPLKVVGQEVTSVLDAEDPISGKPSVDLNCPLAHSLS